MKRVWTLNGLGVSEWADILTSLVVDGRIKPLLFGAGFYWVTTVSLVISPTFYICNVLSRAPLVSKGFGLFHWGILRMSFILFSRWFIHKKGDSPICGASQSHLHISVDLDRGLHGQFLSWGYCHNCGLNLFDLITSRKHLKCTEQIFSLKLLTLNLFLILFGKPGNYQW